MNSVEFVALTSALESIGKTNTEKEIINVALQEIIDYRLALVRLAFSKGLTKDEYDSAVQRARKLIGKE